jgi:Ca2+/Na+ antiporter
MAAVVMVYVMAALNAAYGVAGIGVAIDGEEGGLIFALINLGIAAMMVFLLAKGLREGRRGSRVVAIVIGAFFLLYAVTIYGQGYMLSTVAVVAGFGLALILLVTVPETSRDWFRRR